MKKEIEQLKEFILNPSKERAKDHLVFPFFQKLFGKKFKKESDAGGADIYIEGKLIVELKSDTNDYLQGFYQALHYEKKGLTFSAITVICNNFIGLWKLKDIPFSAKELSQNSDPLKAPNEIGRINANKTNKSLKKRIIETAVFKISAQELDGIFADNTNIKLHEYAQILRNLEADRIQIAPHNFIQKIELLKQFFETPMDAIHCFYDVVGFWNITSKVIEMPDEKSVQVVDFIAGKSSTLIIVKNKFKNEFKKFIETHYVFTNEGSGLSIDYYFSRFDEVISKLDPEYAKQHGIFFTDDNLSKFALWFVRQYYEKKLSDKYIVFDPAAGSGNLVTSWRGHLKHKIVSELEPDLLKTVERRMQLDPEHLRDGFTIIPKTIDNKGLNFLDKSAEEYVHELMLVLCEKNQKLDKPLAFLLNPPYKNTDENVDKRAKAKARYKIHPSILEITGNDAGNERYLAFLGQILNICRLQMGELPITKLNLSEVTLPEPLDNVKVETPILLIFTPTSWLIPRPTYVNFRKEFDKYFKYEMGFIFIGNEFFKIKGKFPIAFTIWKYNYNAKGNDNIVKVKDLTFLTKSDLQINWISQVGNIKADISKFLKKSKAVVFDTSRGDIRNLLPNIYNVKKKVWEPQPRYNSYRNKLRQESKLNIISGFPLKDSRHFRIKAPHGFTNGAYVGFMDDITPVRIYQDNCNRMSNKPDRIWFRLDSAFININQTKILNGPPDNRGFCAYNMDTAKVTLRWFAITKSLNGRYPIWANQYDIWPPKIKDNLREYFYSLCFAFGLAENRCVVTKFEENNPVDGAPEIFVDNPMSPLNPESFWASVLDTQIKISHTHPYKLVQNVKELYNYLNNNYCKGRVLTDVGLKDEPYFKYFDYPDFLTQNSGLIQLKRYADINNDIELMQRLNTISSQSKDVKEKIYQMLIEDFKYFE